MSDSAKSQKQSPPTDKTIAPQIEARVLADALPYMQRYDQQCIVIKFGGHAMVDPELSHKFARDITLLRQAGLRPIVVHGGGPQISRMLEQLNIKSEFDHGQRRTCAQSMEVVEMVLSGQVNKQIVAAINAAGGQAVGISGKDAGLMIAKKLHRLVIDPATGKETPLDLGFVGEPEECNPHIVEVLSDSQHVPVIAPIGISRDGRTSYNINADFFAGALAARLGAKRLLLLTDVAGVLDQDGVLIEELTIEQAEHYMQDGTITGGMIPKIESCLHVIRSGVEGVVILDGRVPHAVLLELLTRHGAGTLLKSC